MSTFFLAPHLFLLAAVIMATRWALVVLVHLRLPISLAVIVVGRSSESFFRLLLIMMSLC